MPTPAKTPVRAYGPAQLPSGSATRYTVPAGKVAVLRQIRVINPTGGAVTFTVSIGTDAAATRLISARSIAAGGEYDRIGYWVLGEGEVLQANASAGTSLVMTVFGDEYGPVSMAGANDRSQAKAANDATSSATFVSCIADAATPHTKGAWAELVSSTAFRVRKIALEMTGIASSGAITSCLVDLGTGAVASEVVLIPNINHGATLNVAAMPFKHEFFVDIPAGTRIAVRCQGTVLSQAVACSIRLFASGGAATSASSVTTYGAATATSVGVTPATPAGANAEGAWTEVTAATTADHGWLNVSVGGPATISATASGGLIDIGYGASGLEQVLIPNIPFNVGATEDIRVGLPSPSRVNLPSGTRLAVRLQASVITGTFKPTVCLHGYGALVT